MFTTENINLSEKDIKRFWKKVRVGKPNACWPWLAARTKFGHGVFSIRHDWINAHRVSFFMAKGYLPNIKAGRLVMHDCENPSCQNPAHLLDGTVKQNGGYEGHRKKQREKIGSNRGKFGKAHTTRYGKKHSDDTKRRLSELAIKRGGWKACNEKKRADKLVPRHENLLIFKTPEAV